MIWAIWNNSFKEPRSQLPAKWTVVESGTRIILEKKKTSRRNTTIRRRNQGGSKPIFLQRTVTLCGVTVEDRAAAYIKKKLISGHRVQVPFWRQQGQEWTGDIWVRWYDDFNNYEESLSVLLLWRGLATLAPDYKICPNAISLKMGQDRARQEKVGVWRSK